MKKTYFEPETRLVKIALQQIIAASPNNVTLSVDDEQVTDQSGVGARGIGSVWDDEEE